MSKKLQLLCFVVAVVAVVAIGWWIGWAFLPGDWYAHLNKPSFVPPNKIFPWVWTVLYVLIGIVGWRIWCLAHNLVLKRLWVAQMVLNYAWSPVFFGTHHMLLGLAVIALLWACIALFIYNARRSDHISSWLFAPYLVWISIAFTLNASLLQLN